MPASENSLRAASRGDSLIRRLAIRPGALGDFIVSLPALESLAPAEIWCTAENVPLARRIAPAQSITSTGLDLFELGLAPAALAKRLGCFDEIVSWYGSARSEFRESVSHLPFRFFPALPQAGSDMHAVDFYLAQAGAPPGAVPALRLGDAARRRSYIAIHPFSGSLLKNWPIEHFEAVARRLPLPVEWSAGPGENLAGARRFASRLDLAFWLGEARCYLGNDSGVSHLAAAAGTPVVALFGPTDPGIWAPRGERVTVMQQSAADVEQVARLVLDCL